MKTIALRRGALSAVTLSLTLLAAALPASAAAPVYGSYSDDTPAPCPAGTVNCPASDPFYRAPANLAALPDGALVGVRPATIATGGPTGRAAFQISYRSSDSFGAPVLDTATVFLPAGSYGGSGPQPLVSFQYPIDSLGGQCSPSYSLQYNTNNNVQAETGDVQTLLTQGYVVVAPDFDGPAEQFIAGQQEGHAVLDGIRAAETLPGAGLSKLTPVALDGYSGGAHATAWAQELAAGYAPELDIKAAAEGGTPADLSATGKYLDGTAFFGLDFLAFEGLVRAFPGDGIQNQLNAAGRAAFAQAADECVGQGVSAYPGGHFDSYTTKPDEIDQPNVQALLTHEKLGQSAPRFPIFSYHVYNDEIVPYTQDVALVEYYCAHRVPVDFVSLAGDHISGEAEGSPLVTSFLAGVFNGAPPPDDCASLAAVDNLPQVPALTLPGSGSGSGSGPGSGAGSGSGSGSPAPTARTEPVTHVGPVSAVFNGAIDTRGQKTLYQFQIAPAGQSFTRGTPVGSIPAGRSGTTQLHVREKGLHPLTSYRIRLVAVYSTSSDSEREIIGQVRRFRTAGAGKLTLVSGRLLVRAGRVHIDLRCSSVLRCTGGFSIDARTKLAGGGASAAVLCASDNPRSFTIAPRRRAVVIQRVRRGCLSLLRRSGRRGLRAQLTSALRTGQKALIERVVLVLAG